MKTLILLIAFFPTILRAQRVQPPTLQEGMVRHVGPSRSPFDTVDIRQTEPGRRFSKAADSIHRRAHTWQDNLKPIFDAWVEKGKTAYAAGKIDSTIYYWNRACAWRDSVRDDHVMERQELILYMKKHNTQ